MAEQLKVEKANLTSYKFQETMIALISDYLDISPQKNQEISSILEEGKEISPLEAFKSNREFRDKNIRFGQFHYAIFNYMNSIFERSINNLLKFAISTNDDVRRIYLAKFIDYDNELIGRGGKSIRDANYEFASPEDKLDIQLGYFDNIISLIPSAWQTLLTIPDSVMWDDKNLKFDYSELRARRHLLTHRGVIYDQKYVDEVKRNTTKSKKGGDPKERFTYFNKYLFFTYSDLNTLDDLVGKKVRIPKYYMLNSFYKLCRLFHVVSLYSGFENEQRTTQLQLEFTNLGVKYESVGFLFYSRLFSQDLQLISKEHQDDFVKGNYLISCIEEKKLLKKEYRKKIHEDEYCMHLSQNNHPLFKFLVAYYNGDSRNYKQIISQIEDNSLGRDYESWPLFNGIKKNKTLMKILSQKVKKPEAKVKAS